MARKSRAKGDQKPAAEEGQPQDHGRQRTIYLSGNSWVVAVPPWVRALMDRKDGGSVYWHEFRPGEAVLTAQPVRGGGRPTGPAAERRLARLTRENLRLRRRLRARPLAVFNEGARHGVAVGQRLPPALEGSIEAINDRLRRIEDSLGMRRGPWKYRAKRARPRQVEVAPAPVLEAPAEQEAPA